MPFPDARPGLLPGALAALLLAPLPVAAQLDPPHRPVRFERAALEPFLPQSSVYVVHQDRRGFLWFGTREGLGWDGYEMRTWKATPFAPNALPGNMIRRLVEDREGSLWVQVLPTDRQTARIARIVGPAHETVETFDFPDATPFLDAAGGVWLAGTDSLYRFDAERGGFMGVRARVTPGTPAGSALFDRAGVLWVGTDAGMLERYDPEGSARGITPDDPWVPGEDMAPLRFVFEDDRGHVWIPVPRLGGRFEPAREAASATMPPSITNG